jgi:hypothetical protein
MGQNAGALESSQDFGKCAVNVIGAVTAGAAGLAAVLAAINLYLTGRREVHKWTREALVEALVMYLDTSIKQGVCAEPQPLGDRCQTRNVIVFTRPLLPCMICRPKL